jgi:GDSL-like Lipase/Acylhydrolase family
MRRFLILVGGVVLSATAFSGPVAAAEPQATLYIAMGDSLAWGDGASVPERNGYVPRLAGYFSGAKNGGAERLINLAVPGATTSDLRATQLVDAVTLIGDPATDTRVITISIGGNDLLDLINDPSDPCLADATSPTCQFLLFTAMSGVATNMPVILGSLQAALLDDPGAESIYVLLPYNAFSGTGHPLEGLIAAVMLGADGSVDCTVDPSQFGLNDILGCTAQASGAVVVDAYPLFEGHILELTHMGEGFNVHPNDDGYEVIAKAHRRAAS